MQLLKARYRWVISFVSVLVVTGALGFGRFGYTVILPAMQDGLSLTTTQTGDLAAGNMTGYLILAVLGGLLASRIGASRVIIVSLFLVSAAMFLTGVANEFGAAFLGRALTGLGAGGANVPIMGLLAAWFSRERRGLASGIAVSGSSFGILITGLSVPSIIRAGGVAGWRNAWYALAIGVAVIAIVSAVLLRDAPNDITSKNPNASDRKPSREDWRNLFRSGNLWIISLIYFAFGFSYVIFATFFSKALISAGMSAPGAGRLWSTIGAASIASGFIWGVVSDTIGRRVALALIYSLQGLAFLAFGLQQLQGGGMAGYFVAAALFSVTAWSIPAVIAAAASDIAGPRMASAAFGSMTLFFGFGQIFGPFTAGRLIEAAGAYWGSYLLAAGVAIMGAVASIIFIPSRLSMRS